MKKLIALFTVLSFTLAAIGQNDTTRYTMVNGYGFTYNRLKAKAALVMPADTIQNKLPGSLVVLNDSLYVRTGVKWEKIGANAAVDTVIMSTRAWRQKGDDSVSALVALRVRISDTASMLLPYLRKSDTSAMLSPYFRKGDTVTLSNRINTKLNISDTSAMLAPYAKAVAGLPIGGTTGQILAKNSATNYDVAWIDNYTTDVRETVKATESINKGQAVYVTGADGANVLVSKASNASDATSSKTLGLLYQNLATNGQGFVIIQGRLSGLNTIGANAGDPVWLGTNGNLLYGTANKPVAPAHLVYLGVVTRVNANNGEIFVHVQNGFELEELHDVLITDSVNNQVIAYDSTTRLWKNKTIAQALGYTPANNATTVKYSDTASMLSPYIRAAGYGLIKSGQSLLVDTAAIATRDRVQKAVDSLGAGKTNGSGTVNYVPKWTATSTLGNSLLTDNGVELKYTGADGLNIQGTTSGFMKIYGTADNYLQFADAAGSAGNIRYNHTNNFMSFQANDAERMRINSLGWVGIATQSPLFPFQVNTYGGIDGNGNQMIIRNNLYYDNTNNRPQPIVSGYQTQIEMNNNDGTMRFSTSSASNTVGSAASIAERMRIWNNGNVGINTTTDAGYRLDVNGTLRTVNGANFATTSGSVGIGTTSPQDLIHMMPITSPGYMRYGFATTFPDIFGRIGHNGNSGGFEIYTQYSAGNTSSGNIRFINGASGATTEKMRITHDGVVAIGNNSSIASNTILQVAQTGDQTIRFAHTDNAVGRKVTLRLTNTNASYFDAGVYMQAIQGSGIDNYSLALGTTGVNQTTASERMRINNAGNVGIGTESPAFRLDVQNLSGSGAMRLKGGTSTSQGAAYYITTAASTNTLMAIGDRSNIFGGKTDSLTSIYTGSGYPLLFDVGGSERARIDAVGSVGIGTTSPQQKTHINADAGGYLQLSRTAQGGTSSPFGGIYFGDGTTFQQSAILSYADGNLVSGNMQFFTRAAAGALTERMRINAAGNVGIGTASPNQKITIQSGVGEVAGISMRANALTSSDEVFIGQGSAGSLFLSNRSTNAITFQIGGFTRMNLTNDAELFINTVSDAGDYKLQVAGNMYGTGTLNVSGSAVLANGSGDVGIGLTAAGQSGFKNLEIGGSGVSGLIDVYQGTSRQLRIYNSGSDSYLANVTNGGSMLFRTTTSGGTQNTNLFITSAGESLFGTTTDVGDYRIQSNGNVAVTGKIDVTANTSIGQSIIRSGTSDVAAQVFNSNGWFLYGAEGANGGAIFTGSTPYAAVAGSGYNRPLQFGTNSTVRMEIDSTGLVGINTTAPTERLDVNGKARIRTVDSTAGAMNMLYVDATGVIKKTAVPGSSIEYYTDVNTIASGWTYAKDSTRNLNHNFINVVKDVNTNEATATMQIAVYKSTSSFTTGSWQSIATVPAAYAPKTTVYYELPGYVDAATFYTSSNVRFTGASEYTGTKVVSIDPSGNVTVRIGTVSGSVTSGGTNYVLIPLALTWVVYNVPQ